METCYKVFRREVLQNIKLQSDRFGFEPEITAKIAKGNWRIYEVSISYAGRTYAGRQENHLAETGYPRFGAFSGSTYLTEFPLELQLWLLRKP